MKKLFHILFILTVLSSYSQQNVIPDYDLAAKFSPKKIAKLVQNVKSNVWIIKDGKKVDASSIIDILTLVCPKGSMITLKIDDQSDLGILNDLVQLIESGFGE